jgi:hypothetical protein
MVSAFLSGQSWVLEFIFGVFGLEVVKAVFFVKIKS